MENVLNERSVPQKILDSALQCISREGYARVSLRDIAKDAGVALSQLNYYFKNKEGLYRAVVEEISADYALKIEKSIQKMGTAKEKLNSMTGFLTDIMHDKPETAVVLLDLVSMSIWNETFKSMLSGLFDDFSGLIKKYIIGDQALKRDGFSADAMSKAIVGALFGTIMQYILNPSDKSIDETFSCIDLSFI